jgi:hypothetical protein
MGHKSITVALVLGLISLPLACGGDDDTGGTGGTGGKAGKGGSAGKAAGGKGGTAGKAAGGKGGTAGKAAGGSSGTGTGGTTGGTGGTGGSTGGTGGSTGGTAGTGTGGTTGGTAGTGTGGTGGDSGSGQGGAGDGPGGAAGNGGEGGATDDPRMERCMSICSKPADTSGVTPVSCGNEEICAAGLCDTTGWDADCIETLDAYLLCIDSADIGDFMCYGGTITTDGAAYYNCPALGYEYSLCNQS